MVHGPCRILNPNAPCMEKGRCSKRFPKAFCESTKENNDGYPEYRRRYNGITFKIFYFISVSLSWKNTRIRFFGDDLNKKSAKGPDIQKRTFLRH